MLQLFPTYDFHFIFEDVFKINGIIIIKKKPKHLVNALDTPETDKVYLQLATSHAFTYERTSTFVWGFNRLTYNTSSNRHKVKMTALASPAYEDWETFCWL